MIDTLHTITQANGLPLFNGQALATGARAQVESFLASPRGESCTACEREELAAIGLFLSDSTGEAGAMPLLVDGLRPAVWARARVEGFLERLG